MTDVSLSLQVLSEEEDYQDRQERSPDYFPRLKDPKDPAEHMGLGVPGRIFNHPLTEPQPQSVHGTKV